MSGGPSMLYSRIGGGQKGQSSFESGTPEWGLLAIASLEVLLIALYLGNHQCQFLFGYSDHPEKLFQSSPWRVLALLPFFFGNEMGRKGWGKYLRVHVFTQPQFSLQYSLPHKLCWVPHAETYILYNTFRECIFRYVSLPGWKRSNHSALWSSAWSGELPISWKKFNRSSLF